MSAVVKAICQKFSGVLQGKTREDIPLPEPVAPPGRGGQTSPLGPSPFVHAVPQVREVQETLMTGSRPAAGH